MNDILVEILTWPDGEWKFDPLIRARVELQYPIDCQGVLIDYARCASADRIYTRFKSVTESFMATPDAPPTLDLQAHEAFVLDHFGGEPHTIDEIRQKCNLPQGGILQALYVLWLGGLLIRRDWNSAFSPAKVKAILHARLAKVKDATELAAQTSPTADKPEERPVESEIPEAVKLPTVTLSLAQYLTQIEKAETHYDALGVATDADTAAIKTAYFSLAKQFHPDRYHRESEEMLKRIQSAFTVLAHAHEMLKTPESRDMYNSKMYKEIEAREKRKAAGQPEVSDVTARKSEHGLESFEEGLNMINEEEFEAAAAYLARAVHYSPQNALYHAYFGLALYKADDKHRHKAEGEFQQAVKLDPKNAKVRMMLVDFLIDLKMNKRAEGELKRFLELVPNNKEAMAALAKLK
jgi:Flp pilus assembly protein TadD